MQERVVREIRTLRAMWRALETGSRQVLNGHEGGNPGHKPRMSLRATAPVLDPTRKEEILDFLRHLNKQIHRPILLIWDRLPGHRSRLVQQYIATLEGKIEAFYLPAYAPGTQPGRICLGSPEAARTSELLPTGSVAPIIRSTICSPLHATTEDHCESLLETSFFVLVCHCIVRTSVGDFFTVVDI